MGAAFAFGSYLTPQTTDIPGSAVLVVGVDTAMAILAGLVMFPALFAMGMQPDEGPRLLFVTMTALFEQMPGGSGLRRGFLRAAHRRCTDVDHCVVRVVHERRPGTRSGLSRRRSAALTGVLTWVCASIVILSQGPWDGIRVAGLGLFPFLDKFAGYLLTAGALLMSLYVVFVWRWEAFRDLTNEGSRRIKVGRTWRPFVMLIIPGARNGDSASLARGLLACRS